MLPTGEKDVYSATVPPENFNPKWDFMYFIEIMDNNGNGTIYPYLDKETPYVFTKLIRRIVPNKNEGCKKQAFTTRIRNFYYLFRSIDLPDFVYSDLR